MATVTMRRGIALRPFDDCETPTLRFVAVGPQDSPASSRAVLVAGEDPAKRASVLDELACTMPESTEFEQASELWELLARAPLSRMVILSGSVDEIPAEALMHMVGQRHPGLPVVSL